MNVIYKYVAMAGVLLALLVGAYFYGVHNGALPGKAQIATLQAAYAQKYAAGVSAASVAQKKADAASISEALAAVSQANAAVVARQTEVAHASAAITALHAQLAAYGAATPEGKWLGEKIPPRLVAPSKYCSVDAAGSASAGCVR